MRGPAQNCILGPEMPTFIGSDNTHTRDCAVPSNLTSPHLYHTHFCNETVCGLLFVRKGGYENVGSKAKHAEVRTQQTMWTI